MTRSVKIQLKSSESRSPFQKAMEVCALPLVIASSFQSIFWMGMVRV